MGRAESFIATSLDFNEDVRIAIHCNYIHFASLAAEILFADAEPPPFEVGYGQRFATGAKSDISRTSWFHGASITYSRTPRKVLRWMSHGPWAAMAAMWEAHPYPLWAANPYLG